MKFLQFPKNANQVYLAITSFALMTSSVALGAAVWQNHVRVEQIKRVIAETTEIQQQVERSVVSVGPRTWTVPSGFTPAPIITMSANSIPTAATTSTTTWIATNDSSTIGPSSPAGAVYHQVVDRYFNEAGQEIEVKSATHAVDHNCNPGRRQQDENLMVQDDGKGNVHFEPGQSAAVEASNSEGQLLLTNGSGSFTALTMTNAVGTLPSPASPATIEIATSR